MRRAAWWVGAAAIAVGGCRPSSVAEAEQKGDVAWLDAEGSPAADDALGRLADSNAKAADALGSRARFDSNAYMSAWQGVKRGKKWAIDLMHAGLQDPERAESAAQAVDPKDASAATFVADVDASFSRLAAGGMTQSLAAVLAGAGPAAHDDVVKRLADKTTRASMCVAIAGRGASDDARAALRSAPPESRDSEACVTSVVNLAANDDPTMTWLATKGEPGLLGAASKLQTLECTRLHAAWVAAIQGRTVAELAGLSVPLAAAVKRCPSQMDGVLADAIKSRPDAQAMVVSAIDPFSSDDATLKATCAALPIVARGGASAIVKERASDAIGSGCRASP